MLGPSRPDPADRASSNRAGRPGSRASRVCQAEGVLVKVRAKPGSRAPGVGGSYDGALVVAVAARAVDGAANHAVAVDLAKAFGLPRSAVTLVRGARHRSKQFELDGDPVRLGLRLAELLGPRPIESMRGDPAGPR